jgi:hypothetical protein
VSLALQSRENVSVFVTFQARPQRRIEAAGCSDLLNRRASVEHRPERLQALRKLVNGLRQRD